MIPFVARVVNTVGPHLIRGPIPATLKGGMLTIIAVSGMRLTGYFEPLVKSVEAAHSELKAVRVEMQAMGSRMDAQEARQRSQEKLSMMQTQVLDAMDRRMRHIESNQKEIQK